jgi:hypothetical protein
MFQVDSRIAKISIHDQAEMEGLISHLKDKGHLPVIRSMFTGMFSLVKLPEPDEALVTKVIAKPPSRFLYREGLSEVLGDLFFSDNLIYVLVPAEPDILQLSTVGYEREEEALQKFCAHIEEGIRARFDGRRVRGMEFEWKEPGKSAVPRYNRRYYYPSWGFSAEEPQRGEIDLKSTEPSYSSEDAKIAKLLVDANIRNFSLKLAQVVKVTSKDAAELIKPGVVQRLLSLGLISQEYLLTCKQDHHTICVVSSQDHLTKEHTTSLRCSVCGRLFADENLQAIYTLTKSGKKLVDGSLWMSIWVTELLTENGVRKEAIKWALEGGGEELDIMVEDFNSRVFLELKDREFGLGDAYPFIFRTTRYGGEVGVVATMDKVSSDARNFFKEETKRREHPVEIRYLEGSEGIQKGIAKLIEDISSSQVQKLIRPFSARVGFDLWPVVEHWINMKLKKVSGSAVAATADNNG